MQFNTFDAQRVPEYRQYAKAYGGLPSLADLSYTVLAQTIQVEEHSSVEDARATMELFLRRETALDSRSMAGSSTRSELEYCRDGTYPSPWTSETTSSGPDVADACGLRKVAVEWPRKVRHFYMEGKVALPDIPYLRRGRLFDWRSSIYS